MIGRQYGLCFLFSLALTSSASARLCSEVQQDLLQAINEVSVHNTNGVKALQSYSSKAQQVRNSIDQSLADVGTGSSSQFPGAVIHYRFNSVVKGFYLDPMIQDLQDYSIRFLQNRQPTVNKLNTLSIEVSTCTK